MQPLEALVELERRGAAPERFRPILNDLNAAGMLTAGDNGLPQIAGVIELYSRGVLNDRDNPDFNRNLGRQYLPIMQRLVAQGLVTPYVPQNQRDGTLRLMQHGQTFGFSDEIQAGLGAVRDRITGDAQSLGEGYDYNLAVQRENMRQARRQTGPIGAVAAEVVGGLLSPAARMRSLGEGATVAQRANQIGLHSAGYGAVQGFGEAEGGIENRGVGAVTGGVLGYGLGAGLGAGIARYGDWRAARVAQAEARQVETAAINQNVAGEFTEAGVPVFAPAVTSSPTIRTTAETVMGSAVGQPLVNSARRSITALEGQIGETIAEAGGRRASDELGQEVQGLLRRSLDQNTIPGAVVNRMTPAEAEAISHVPTGPGYVPPRPRVDPVPPVEIQPVQPRTLTIDDVPTPAVHVPPEPVRTNYRPFESVTLEEINPQIAQRIAAARAEIDGVSRIHNERVLPAARQAETAFRRDMNELFRSLQRDPQSYWILRERGIHNLDDFINSGVGPQRNALGLVDDLRHVRGRYEQINARFDEALRPYAESNARYEALATRIRELEAQGERIRDEGWRLMVQNEHGNAVRRAEEATTQRRVSAETSAREQALARALAEENERAIQETARMRGTARSEADAATRARQREADAKYDADMASYSPHYRPGASREHSYKTEFDAAYRQIEANAPGQIGNYMSPIVMHQPPKRVNVMGKTVEIPQQSISERTAVMELINDFGREGRGRNLLRGWKDYDFNSQMLWDYLRNRLGGEVAGRLHLGVIPNKGKGSNLRRDMPLEGLRHLRTTVRRTAEAPFRPDDITDRAMLQRLNGAMTEDLQTMLRSKYGPEYTMAADRLKMVDAAYGKHKDEMVDTLRKLFGDNVAPEQALQLLQKAAQRSTHDIDLLRKFYRVATEKGDVKRATGAILSNMAEGGMPEFLKRYGGLSSEAKKIMFAGNAGELGNALERLHRIARRLEPYMIEGRGLDLFRVPNMLMGATLMFHIPAGIAQAVGMNGMARLLASDRFLNWLTAMPKARTAWTPEFREGMGRLRNILMIEFGLTDAAADAMLGDVTRNIRGQPRSRAAA
jgi:hypothetical protein